MEKSSRTKIIRAIQENQNKYIDSLAESPHKLMISNRCSNIKRKLKAILRKTEGSANSLKTIPNIARLLFGVEEDIQRLGLPKFDLYREKAVINKVIIAALHARINSKYDGTCRSYGEVLLNCYLDLFVTLTVLKLQKEIGAKPAFLVNPVTGSILEIDILFQDFHLGFEFQGDHHYRDTRVQAKDNFKLAEFDRRRRILIPVNISQLESKELQSLIINSIKDHLGIQDLLTNRDLSFKAGESISSKEMRNFCKVTQRIYLARTLFQESIDWLNQISLTYTTNAVNHSPISSSSEAPRQNTVSSDLDVEYIYQNLRFVRK